MSKHNCMVLLGKKNKKSQTHFELLFFQLTHFATFAKC